MLILGYVVAFLLVLMGAEGLYERYDPSFTRNVGHYKRFVDVFDQVLFFVFALVIVFGW